ncbi:signal peptidase I [Vaginisenegalia massiliensis]|uniref:signal peptidase I n=1 Tax=Vaginisenegalia massiliensis TaxID=2058294 RepID=UPI000F52BBAB|nr:signal peptidase I [Vaginisenegalia massiliensis]
MQVFRQIFVDLVNVLFGFFIAVLIYLALRSYVFMPFQVSGHSMDPTLADGQHMLLSKQSEIKRFDIIVVPDPSGSGKYFVKRLIGLPGDQLEMKHDQLRLNGHVIKEPYLSKRSRVKEKQPFTEDFSLYELTGYKVIPAGYCFVMGDNRPHSGDSRQFGLIPIESIQGEANIRFYPFQEAKIFENNLSNDKLK